MKSRLVALGSLVTAFSLFVASAEPIPLDRVEDIRQIISVLATTRVSEITASLAANPIFASSIKPPGGYIVVVSDSRSLCINDPNTPGADCIYSMDVQAIREASGLPEVPEALRTALLHENQERTPLPAIAAPTVKLATAASINALFLSKDGWKTFYAQYPGSFGFVEISIPTFSPDCDHALTYLHHGCGSLCGTGELLYLTRVDGIWRIEKSALVWVS
jgi:hypothetical protein